MRGSGGGGRGGWRGPYWTSRGHFLHRRCLHFQYIFSSATVALFVAHDDDFSYFMVRNNIEEAVFNFEMTAADFCLLPQEQLSVCVGPQSGPLSPLSSEAFRNVLCKYPDGHPSYNCTAHWVGYAHCTALGRIYTVHTG